MSNEKVISLVQINVDPETLEMAERLLERVQSGEVTAFALAMTTNNNEISTCFTKNKNHFGLIGALEWLKHRMLEKK